MVRDEDEELPDEAAGAGTDKAVGAGAGIAVTPDWSKYAGGSGRTRISWRTAKKPKTRKKKTPPPVAPDWGEMYEYLDEQNPWTSLHFGCIDLLRQKSKLT